MGQRTGFYAGLFCITLSMMMLEVIQTRILSVVAWYYLAFFVISLAMFGLSAGSLWIYRRADLFGKDQRTYQLTFFSSAYALAIALCSSIQLTLPLTTIFTATGILVWGELVVCLSVPFFLAGVVTGLALTRSPYPIGYVYCADLLGAAAGCLVVLLIMNYADGPQAVWISAVMAGAGSVCFAKTGLGSIIPNRWNFLFLHPRILVSILLIACVINQLFDIGFQPLLIKENLERRDKNLLFEKWNSYSRVAVYNRGMRTAHLWGASPRFPNIQKEWRILNIDGAAGSPIYRFRGNTQELEFLKYDVTNFAYALKNNGKVAIIGFGGGRDLLSAWYFGFREITGIELNSITVDLLTKEPGFAEFAAIRNLPGVRLIADEARSWFSRSNERFDLIQMSMIDTWAATGAGAFSLSENGLYTVEAWKSFLGHLQPDGVLTVSRWYAPGEINETGRMISLAVAALMELGVEEPRRHLFLVSANTRLATLVLSRSPWTEEQIQTLQSAADTMQFPVIFRPDHPTESEILRTILQTRNTRELEKYTASLPLNLMPPRDDCPFFFNQLPFDQPLSLLKRLFHQWGTLRPDSVSEGVITGNLLATRTLVLLGMISLILMAALILFPLRTALRVSSLPFLSAAAGYFMLIGMGFMFVEIGFLQRLNVFLGHPVYSLSIVLFGLILATGLGSFISERWQWHNQARMIAWSVMLSGYLFLLSFGMPVWFSFWSHAGILSKSAAALSLILPAGMLMGFAFPGGMRLTEAIDPRPTPWFWAVNGAAGVVSSILAVMVSIAWGIHVNFWIASACYLLLIPPAMFMLARHGRLAEPSR